MNLFTTCVVYTRLVSSFAEVWKLHVVIACHLLSFVFFDIYDHTFKSIHHGSQSMYGYV